MKNILILSISSYTLLQAKVLLEEKNINHLEENTFVYHYEHTNNIINKTEQFLCKEFKFKYVKSIGRINEYFQKLRKIKKISLLFSKYLWKREIKFIFPEMQTIDYVIMPYRPYLSDYLLSNIFSKATKILYVSDGYLIDHNIDFIPSMKFKYTRFNNKYQYINYNPIYCFKGLEFRLNHFGNARLLSEKTFNKVLDGFKTNDYFIKNSLNYKIEAKSNSLFILQNLFPRFIASYEQEILLYSDIINEYLNTNQNLFIKFHPRDTGKKIELMKDYFKDYKNVIFIEQNTFGTLPLEIIINELSVTSIIGFTTTSLPILNVMVNNLQINIYKSGIEKIDLSSKDMLDDLGIKLKNLK